MKIAIFSDFLHPELSGVSDSVKNLSCALADLGHTVMIVAPAYSKSDYKIIGSLKKEINLGPNIIIKRLPSFSVPFSPTGQNRFPLFLGKGIYLMWKFKPDIIHTNSPLVPGIEAFISSKLFKIPFIGTNHTPVSEFVKGPKWFVRLICRYWSWFYNMCDFVSTPSQFLIDYMRNHGFNSHKAIPISNPIDISKFSPAENISQKNELKKKFGFSKYTALFAGRLAEEKHVDDIIRAISLVKKEIPEISLVLTGHGKDEGRMKELSKELGILDAVHFLGFVDEKTYPLIFKASDIFTIMSTAESQGMSMILAMASGLPIIAAKARGLPEFIDNQNGLLVEIGDYKDLAKKIIELLKDQKLSKKMGENGIIFASKLSSDSIGKVWEKIYSDTLTGTNSYIKSKHKISLIIPAYNEEKYIGSCLDHAIKNSGGKFSEIIVVDNVSTDSTKSLAERRPGVRVIREERKIGRAHV